VEAPTPVFATWKILVHDLLGNLIEEKNLKNLVVQTGRTQLLRNLFALSASGGVIALGVGACTTTATLDDTRLNYELIGNAARKPLTNTSGAALSPSDIVNQTSVIVLNASSSATFYQQLTCQAVYNSGDSNNGNQFGEYGLFTVATNPATPTSTSGVMYNHLIDPSPTPKSAANAITVQVTVYF
jgi:hypothetical protein